MENKKLQFFEPLSSANKVPFDRKTTFSNALNY